MKKKRERKREREREREREGERKEKKEYEKERGKCFVLVSFLSSRLVVDSLHRPQGEGDVLTGC